MHNKAIAAAVMSLLALMEEFIGRNFGINEEWVITTIAILTPIIVWLIPNRQPTIIRGP